MVAAYFLYMANHDLVFICALNANYILCIADDEELSTILFQSFNAP
jgi:hypothetical protein